MRRSLFGSPIARQSPTAEKAEQDRNKRRSFAFMKYSPKTTNTSMRRTREHARQIAMQLSSDDVDDSFSSPFGDDNSVASFDLKPIAANPQRKENKLDQFVARQQHLQHPKPAGPGSMISVDTSVSSTSSRGRKVKAMPTFPSNSTMIASNVARRTPEDAPASPYALSHSKGSTGSARSVASSQGSGGKSNRLVSYSQTPRAPITPGGGNVSISGGSFSSESSNNFFTEDGNGFSFDAFGLDANQVDQEVAAAMRELAGEWGDEFPVQSFDSPAGSRASTPPTDEDGFENGFRLTGISGLPLQVRSSPAGSDRSSSTTSYSDKDRANFFKGTPPRPPRQTKKQSSGNNDWAEFGDSAFGDSAFGDPFAPGFGESQQQQQQQSFGTPNLPQIPQLDQSRPNTFDQGFVSSFSEFPPRPARRGPQSHVSMDATSDVNVSDVGVSSDVCVSSDVGPAKSDFDPVPFGLEVAGSKKKRNKGTPEEKKHDGDDESFAEWSTRSPVKGNMNWGEDMTPDNDDEQQSNRWPVSVPGFVGGLKKVAAKKEPTVQEIRAKECAQQRTSFGSLKSRLKAPKADKPSGYAKSDIGVIRSQGSSELNAVLDRVRRGASFDDGDVGRASPFSGSVASKASKFEQPQQTPSNAELGDNYDYGDEYYEDDGYREDDYPEGEDDRQYYDDEQYGNDDDQEEYQDQPPQGRAMGYGEQRGMTKQQQGTGSGNQSSNRKPTYREQRELELKRERDEQKRKEEEAKSNQPPELDIAALIRKRVAANRRMMQQNGQKRISIESKITQFRAPQEEGPPEFLVTTLKKVSVLNPADDGALSPTPSQSTTVTESRSTTSGGTPDPGDFPSNFESSVSRDAPSPMAAVHAAIASKGAASSRPINPMAAVHAAISGRAKVLTVETSHVAVEPPEEVLSPSKDDTKKQLNAFFANRLAGGPNLDVSAGNDDGAVLLRSKQQKQPATDAMPSIIVPSLPSVVATHAAPSSDGRPALKNDPKYDRYFRMLKVGMPMDVVKHAMTRDGIDPSVMDGDHNKPVGYGGVPLKEDPKYDKYFKMLKIGLPMGAVKNAMERDGVDPSVMDRDHNLPAATNGSNGDGEPTTREVNLPKDTHRRTRLHWDTLRKVRTNSLWAKIDEDEELEDIQIDEDEFQELFQAELTPAQATKSRNSAATKRGAAVRVIESKRANNGGIILARLKMTHDEMADAVDRIDHRVMSAEQMQNIIEYLPTKDERKSLESYMLSGGTDAAEKFDGLCECEKFMVAMMTVKHAKRKVRALLFKLQFQSCLEHLQTDATCVESACDELSNSVRLRKLLGIVLNIGNRLNTAGAAGKRKAGAFSLDSLLKLSQAKAFDKKTTFLHYLVLVVQRNNELLLRFKDDIPTVMKADRVYWDQVEQDLEEVENQLENVRRIALHQAQLMNMYKLRKKKPKATQNEDDENSLSDSSMTLEEEVTSLRSTDIGVFTLGAIKKVSALREKVETTKAKFKKLREYFGEDEKEAMQPHELFNILSKFCRDFEHAKEQVAENQKKKMREERMLKRSNSDSNVPSLPKGKQAAHVRTHSAHTEKEGPSRMNSAPLLRSSNHQPSISRVTNDAAKSARNGQYEGRQPGPPKPPDANQPPRRANGIHPGHPDPRRVIPQQRPPNQAPRHDQGPRPTQQPPTNQAPRPNLGLRPPQQRAQPSQVPRPPMTSSSPDDERMSSSMRQKAMQRRRRMHDKAGTASTSTVSTFSSSAPPLAPNATYSALGRRVANNTAPASLSPRSSIRHRRHQEQRRDRESPSPELRWPSDAEDNLDDMEFALD